jgi:hypothetical protein
MDKIDKPDVVEKNLQQLTAHKGKPYLFICGTFIGSTFFSWHKSMLFLFQILAHEHIDSYHKGKQIPQLVEYVCGTKKDKETTTDIIASLDKSRKVGEKKRRKKKKHSAWNPATAIVSSYVVSSRR